jgi:hypothetical protein
VRDKEFIIPSPSQDFVWHNKNNLPAAILQAVFNYPLPASYK